MKNILNREVNQSSGFSGIGAIDVSRRKVIDAVKAAQHDHKLRDSLEHIFDEFHISDGMTLSFHHHMRNGDHVLNMVASVIKKRNIKDLTIAISSVFPIHAPLVELIEKQNITKMITSYANGPVAKAISEGKLKKGVVMQSHGRRAQAIECGDVVIDVAFIATPAADALGNGNGVQGKNACGVLGYAIADMLYAKKKVVITDHLLHELSLKEIDGDYIDAVLVVDSIGEQKGIVSGTTQITMDPINLKIARDTAKLIDTLGAVKNGMTFQTGAGGTSLAVAAELRKIMKARNIVGRFASGGITGYLVQMHEEGLFQTLYDVQCFDLDAVRSYRDNEHHLGMSASKYANPYEEDVIVNQLDVVILGATEIDLDFNVNVTTDSNGLIIGGSGGHQDTAFGADLTIITTSLVKSRMPILKRQVTTVTTPGETVDVLVTERGIAINPRRKDLLDQLKGSKLNILPMADLLRISNRITGIPQEQTHSKETVGVVEYRDGTVIDTIWKKGD